MRSKIWVLTVCVLIAAIVLLVGGCSLIFPETPEEDDAQGAIDPSPIEDTITVLLYFGDPSAEGLAREERAALRGSERTEAVVIRELIRGPDAEGLLPSIPQEARLLDIRVTEGTAFVSFSREIQTRHPGGSTGEMLTVYSIVNSLTELPGIVQVQILIEGDKAETLAGHMEIMNPLARNPYIILP